MKDLKNYREKELSLYIISCIMLFLVMHQFIIIDNNDLPNIAETISQIFVSTVLSAIAFGFILVTECLFTSAFKEKLLYLYGFFGLLNLPGCTIFTRIRKKNKDKRFSYESLIKKYPTLYENMPTEKNARLLYENEKWYAIYNHHRDVSMIHSSQRDWLLCRDIYISTIIMLVLYVIASVLKSIEFDSSYLLFLLTMLVITNFGTNRKAARFAYNVIAYDVNESSGKENN